MKTFLITITILGAIIYGILEINEYYDDRGACSWGLFSGGDYRHKERLDKAIKGVIEYSIKQDKKARQKLMEQKGLSKEEITKKIKFLETQYEREREKIVKYCNVDTEIFQKQIIRYNEFTTLKTKYEQMPIYAQPSKYCKIDNMNDYKDMGYGYFGVQYTFDEESHNFFNTIQYVHNKNKKNQIIVYVFDGVRYEALYNPCEVRFKGINEGSTVLITDKETIYHFDKTKYVNIRF